MSMASNDAVYEFVMTVASTDIGIDDIAAALRDMTEAARLQPSTSAADRH